MHLCLVLLALLSAVVASSSSNDTLADPQRLLCSVGDLSLIKRQGINFRKYGGSKWRNGTIPYSIVESDFNSDQLKTIQDAINEWNKKINRVQLVRRSNETDYVQVFSGSGCWSYLGRIGGQQRLSLQQNGCVSSGTVQHEFVHAAGFSHEHDRSDRDEHVTILWQNIPERWQSQYQKVNPDDYTTLGHPYDYYSVMHYPIWAPDSGGKDAFAIPSHVDRNRLGQNDGLTDTDVRKINAGYS